MKILKSFAVLACALCLGLSALGVSTIASAADFSGHKTAVVTFSLLHNRVHGNPDAQEGKIVSNTEVIGNLIAENTKADVFALHTVELYPEDYDATVDQAREEQRAGARPALKEIPDLAAYDVVFIGYPNWWGTYPMAIASFLENSNLDGKIVIPFCTHEGSRLGRSQGDLEAALPNATVLEGFECRGRDVNDEDVPQRVQDFLNELSF